jgi:hypothetical protein
VKHADAKQPALGGLGGGALKVNPTKDVLVHHNPAQTPVAMQLRAWNSARVNMQTYDHWYLLYEIGVSGWTVHHVWGSVWIENSNWLDQVNGISTIFQVLQQNVVRMWAHSRTAGLGWVGGNIMLLVT